MVSAQKTMDWTLWVETEVLPHPQGDWTVPQGDEIFKPRGVLHVNLHVNSFVQTLMTS